MATILLSAAGAAIGGAVGGGALGLSSVVIGRAIGATVGRAIDQSIMGSGSEVVETGRLDRMKIMGASEGGVVPRVFGRTRVAGNVIWTSNYRETTSTHETGGKGAPKGPTTKSYSYSINVAIALCEGEISRVGRVWADGIIVNSDDLNMIVHRGSEDQMPDAVMSAIEGEDKVPAYRGLAYVVFENLELEQFGNRVPQFSFEVVRPSQPKHLDEAGSLADVVRAVALLPGSGEYALATTPIFSKDGIGTSEAANMNSEGGQVDLAASLDALTGELPKCRSTSLVVSWFGDDLRAGHCRCVPKVEKGAATDSNLVPIGTQPIYSDDQEDNSVHWRSSGRNRTPWNVSGITRDQAEVVSQIDGRPIYGGTPTDASVIEAIDALKVAGQNVMFYPFLLMEIVPGNDLPDPWNGQVGQPSLPWRGRITTDRAPMVEGSTDQSSLAADEVASFMGTASAADFTVGQRTVTYSGPEEYSYRRFILHYAHLCAAAGGVSAFCIGSEMRALTQIRDGEGAFPTVQALVELARDVKSILPEAKIGYAADWSEYFGYHPQDGSGDIRFHLDPLWSDDAIDFIGIDNYMPLSDWRDGASHADSSFGSIYNLDYLTANVAAGEGFDFYYRDDQERNLQVRTPISDGAYGEDWIYRYKDLKGWWRNPHHERIGGVRVSVKTSWEPESKPIWFTELGCAAIDKGPNEPNKFLDAKSSESALPHFSTGRRDDYVQLQFLRAYKRFYETNANNPISSVYGGEMVDMSNAHVWAWDSRPWPAFPNNSSVWSDGINHLTGHWLTGRSGVQTLASTVAEICEQSGITNIDVSQLHGVVRGFSIADVETGRASLQILMLAYSFDAVEKEGRITFVPRGLLKHKQVERDDYVYRAGEEPVFESVRHPEAETVGEVRVGFSAGENTFENQVSAVRLSDDSSPQITQNDLPLALSVPEAKAIAERWLSESRVAQETVRFALPPSRSDIQVGDVIDLDAKSDGISSYRVDRIEDSGELLLDATRIEDQIYTPSQMVAELPDHKMFASPIPISSQFMDLPLLREDEVAHAPFLAVTADPWPGSAAVYGSAQDSDYDLNELIDRPSILGVTLGPLEEAKAGIWATGNPLRIQLQRGALSSAGRIAVLNGANAAAIGDGSSDRWEIIQFSVANMVAPDVFDISDLLRGQAGTEHLAESSWPAGSRFVLLDTTLQQIELKLSQRNLARHYRIGPSLRPLGDPSYQHYLEAFKGIGLRPYSPAHLRVQKSPMGYTANWIRRSRIDSDNWDSIDVPLGEEKEEYLIRVVKDGSTLRETSTYNASWHYKASAVAHDGAQAPFQIQVAQVSQSFGPGPFVRKKINE